MEAEIVRDIIVLIVAAAATGYLAHRLRQPIIVGYIAAGIAVGPELGLSWVQNPDSISFASELGLIMLLFMVGFEIDLRKLLASGRVILVAGLVQIGLCIGLGLAFFSLPGFAGGGTFAVLYLAFTFALSSTMVVVRLLYDHSELDTLQGRLTLGVLVLQDLAAIVFLALQPNLADPRLGLLVLSFGKGLALVAGCLFVGRYVLTYLFRSIARVPELLLVTALAWAFLVSWLSGDVAGLSRAIGALVAGVSLSASPYNAEIAAKMTNIRSFFIILFFASLGMEVREPSLQIFLMSVLASLFLIGSRFATLLPTLFLQRKGMRASFLVPLNISQLSEFSLAIVALGIAYGHVNQQVMTVILFALMMTVAVSSYLVPHGHGIFRALRKLRKEPDSDQAPEAAVPEAQSAPILLLGFYKIARSLLQTVDSRYPEVRKNIAVVDFNPEVYRDLVRRGIRCAFGDLANTDTLMHCGIDKARLAISTIPDTILKGTSNMALLSYIKRVNPSARVVVTAETVHAARRLFAAGADFVILPYMEASDRLAPLLEELLNGDMPGACLEERRRIMEERVEFTE